MHTQRWQFYRDKLIGLKTPLLVAVVLVAATNLPVTAQSIRSERTRFGGIYQAPGRNTVIYSNPSGYINPNIYPRGNYYSYPNPTIRRVPNRQQVIVDPTNGIVYQTPRRNTFIYNNPFPNSSFGYSNPGFYSNPNYYPYPTPIYRRDRSPSNPVLINPTILDSTLINPVIINPRGR